MMPWLIPIGRWERRLPLDSATMVNKGLEVIEAHHLFGIPYDDIHVVLHRESVVHSMVTLKDEQFWRNSGNGYAGASQFSMLYLIRDI